MLRIILIAMITLSLSSCVGLLQVDRNKQFVSSLSKKENKIQKIVSIDPAFDMAQLFLNKNKFDADLTIDRKNNEFNEILIRNARKNDIRLDIVDSRNLEYNDTEFFNYLAPLKRDILQANYLQNFGTGRSMTKVFGNNSIRPATIKTPFISSRYCHLAQKYGTKYFAVQGIRFEKKSSRGDLILLLTVPPVGLLDLITPDMDAFYYTIIADVTTAKVVYREYRKVDLKDDKSDLNSMVYDSFRIIVN